MMKKKKKKKKNRETKSGESVTRESTSQRQFASRRPTKPARTISSSLSPWPYERKTAIGPRSTWLSRRHGNGRRYSDSLGRYKDTTRSIQSFLAHARQNLAKRIRFRPNWARRRFGKAVISILVSLVSSFGSICCPPPLPPSPKLEFYSRPVSGRARSKDESEKRKRRSPVVSSARRNRHDRFKIEIY